MIVEFDNTEINEIGIVIKDSCPYSGLTGSLSRSIKIINELPPVA